MALGQGFIKNFDDMINNLLIEPAGRALGGLVGKIAAVGEGVAAGASGLFANIGDIASGFSLSSSTREAPVIAVETPKLGLNAEKQKDIVPDTSQFAANFNDVVVPMVGAKGPMSQGIMGV